MHPVFLVGQLLHVGMGPSCEGAARAQLPVLQSSASSALHPCQDAVELPVEPPVMDAVLWKYKIEALEAAHVQRPRKRDPCECICAFDMWICARSSEYIFNGF